MSSAGPVYEQITFPDYPWLKDCSSVGYSQRELGDTDLEAAGKIKQVFAYVKTVNKLWKIRTEMNGKSKEEISGLRTKISSLGQKARKAVGKVYTNVSSDAAAGIEAIMKQCRTVAQSIFSGKIITPRDTTNARNAFSSGSSSSSVSGEEKQDVNVFMFDEGPSSQEEGARGEEGVNSSMEGSSSYSASSGALSSESSHPYVRPRSDFLASSSSSLLGVYSTTANSSSGRSQAHSSASSSSASFGSDFDGGFIRRTLVSTPHGTRTVPVEIRVGTPVPNVVREVPFVFNPSQNRSKACHKRALQMVKGQITPFNCASAVTIAGSFLVNPFLGAALSAAFVGHKIWSWLR